jgi:hypothetical protein
MPWSRDRTGRWSWLSLAIFLVLSCGARSSEGEWWGGSSDAGKGCTSAVVAEQMIAQGKVGFRV